LKRHGGIWPDFADSDAGPVTFGGEISLSGALTGLQVPSNFLSETIEMRIANVASRGPAKHLQV
jgi:hypothetical protein